MSFEVKVYKGSTLSEGAALCLDARLFVPGWTLRPTLLTMRDRKGAHPGQIALGFKNDVPVALVLYDGNMLMAFCKKFERYQGFASRCFQALDLEPGSWAGEGIQGTLVFWNKQGVHAIPRDHGKYRY